MAALLVFLETGTMITKEEAAKMIGGKGWYWEGRVLRFVLLSRLKGRESSSPKECPQAAGGSVPLDRDR